MLNGLYLQKKQMKHDVYSLESMLLCAINNYIAELFVSFFSLWGGSHRRSWWPSCHHFCPLYLKPLETRVQMFARYLLCLYLIHEFSFSWVYVFVGNQVGVNFSYVLKYIIFSCYYFVLSFSVFSVYVIDFGLCFDVCWWMVQTVVFCLVDIYIMLGKAFLPYLERLNSTQLRLVTIYANRISQARTGTTIDASQWGAGSFRKILWFWGVGLFFVVYLYIVWIHSGVFFFF